MSFPINGFTVLTTKITKENTYEIREVTTTTTTVRTVRTMSNRQEKSEQSCELKQPTEEMKKVKLKRPSKIMKIKETERKLYENLREIIPTMSRQRTKPTRVEILMHTMEYMNVLERMMIDLKAAGDSENVRN